MARRRSAGSPLESAASARARPIVFLCERTVRLLSPEAPTYLASLPMRARATMSAPISEPLTLRQTSAPAGRGRYTHSTPEISANETARKPMDEIIMPTRSPAFRPRRSDQRPYTVDDATVT
jgi:hypothetical protein